MWKVIGVQQGEVWSQKQPIETLITSAKLLSCIPAVNTISHKMEGNFSTYIMLQYSCTSAILYRFYFVKNFLFNMNIYMMEKYRAENRMHSEVMCSIIYCIEISIPFNEYATWNVYIYVVYKTYKNIHNTHAHTHNIYRHI